MIAIETINKKQTNKQLQIFFNASEAILSFRGAFERK